MRKDPYIFLEHIFDSIKKIEDFVRGLSKENFLRSIQTQDAVIRRIEVIGEASKNISISFKKKYKNVPWSEMARTRDKLIHGYFGVDLNLTFDIIKKDLPTLKKQIQEIIKNKT